MAVDIPAVREIVERVFARQDVLDACKRRDLSWPITVLCANGVTQAQIAALMGDTARTPERVQDAQARSDRYVDVRGVR